jgi:hypothetical protein
VTGTATRPLRCAGGSTHGHAWPKEARLTTQLSVSRCTKKSPDGDKSGLSQCSLTPAGGRRSVSKFVGPGHDSAPISGYPERIGRRRNCGQGIEGSSPSTEPNLEAAIGLPEAISRAPLPATASCEDHATEISRAFSDLRTRNYLRMKLSSRHAGGHRNGCKRFRDLLLIPVGPRSRTTSYVA